MIPDGGLAALKRSVLFSLAVLVLAFAAGPFGAPVLEAQSPPGLEAQHQRLLPLFELNGVVFTDADETRGRLVVGVLNRGLERSVRARLSALGVASESVDVVETAPIVQLATTTLRDRWRPVVGGLQIRFSQYLCSLSFNAVRNDVSGFVTASHCSGKQGTVDGTLYYQPLNQVANEFIGRETVDPAFLDSARGCPKGKKCRYSDANFSAGDGNASFDRGVIAKTTGPNNGSLSVAADSFFVSAEGSALVGTTVNKVGRTTGWTQGRVTATCANTSVLGSSILLFCQNFVGAGSAGGDSGSPVFKINTDGDESVTLLGTLWGGDSAGTMFVYSPIAYIERELGALLTCQGSYSC